MVRHGRLGKPKLKEREQAIALRRQGFSYSEILEKVPVAKSTLSVWLGDVGLTKKQQQRLTTKRRLAQLRGGEARRQQRIETTRVIHAQAEKEVGKLSKRDLWLLGTALYWAEGTKEKEWRTGGGVQFANSDPAMINVFVVWLVRTCGVDTKDIYMVLYIHQNHRQKLDKTKRFWFEQTGYHLQKIYFKKYNPKTMRKNVSDSYYGTAVVNVRSSSKLNRRIAGWVQGIIKKSPGNQCVAY